MVSVEGAVANFVNALRFGVSNVVSLAIWGISYIVTVFISVFILIFGIFFFRESLPVLVVMVVLALLIVLAWGILLMGFASKCLKTVINGGTVMPTGLESPGDLVKDGVMTMVILLEAVVAEFICLAPGYLLVFLSLPDNSALTMAGLALVMLAVPVIFVIFLLNIIQWAIYADTGSLSQGLNPLVPIRMILSSPGKAIVAVVSIIATYIFFVVVMLVCELTIVGALLIPFLVFAMYGCLMYLVATFYRQSRGDDGLPDIHGAVTADFSAS